ncbi:uncharacterized protein LOC119303189 isoform X2 [Triticum dicoccoides]|uniref:uncharacterized protein LOC119303189 isoform X2 n=1 Tax=Triticum dicoccoides TaxID=85692 RepID=UPI00189010C6|nr:uncharacterized protein LOC119303189 isoform X2 [Triticum dicoccoides]
MQFQSGNCAKTLAKVDGSGAKDFSVDRSTFGFPQDANQEYFNRACQYSYPVSTQGFQDKGFVPSVPDFVLNNASAALREYQQFDHFFRPLQPLAPDGNQVQNIGINTAHRSRPSNASSCLDHVEEITSHDTDGYDDRAISFGSSCSTGIACYPYSSPMQSDDCIADTQDGTWAALMQMQQALEAANEECSDLTFNNTELSGGNTMQHQIVWDNGCLASPSFTSNFLPFPGEAETTVTNTSAMYNLHNSADLLYDNDQDISSFELKVNEQKEATTSHVCEHRGEMHSAEQGGYPGHDESFDLTISQDRQFSSFVNGADGSVDSEMNLYDCEEQMEIDSLLNSFGASSDTFAQTYEMLQKGENIVDLEKKAKLAESISATFITNTVPYITQAGATESTVSDGSSWTQQYQSTSQSCGLSYSSASQWETMPGTIFPLGDCQNDVSESNSMTSLGTNGDLLLSFGHTSMQQQQQSVSSDTNLELIDNFANPYQEFVTGVDGQRSHLYRDEALATQGVWAAHPGMQMPLTQTTVQLPAPCLSKDPNSSFIGAEVQKVDQNHSDTELPLTQTSHVQLPAMNLSEYPTSSFVGGTKLKKVDKHDSYMQLPMTHASHVPLPATSLSEDPKSSFIGGTELKEVDKHDSDMQLPRIQASHVPLPAVSLSEEPNSSFIGGTELKEVRKHDSDMPLPMTRASHVPLPAVSLSEDTKSSFIAGAELKEVDKHDSDTPLPMAQASHVPLPTMSLPEDTKSSFIGGTELKEVDRHDSDMQHPMTPASHVLLPAVSMSMDPESSFTGGTELKEVGKHDSDMQLPMTQTVHVQLPTPSLSKDSESSFVGGTELKEVDKHDSDMQPPMTQASHVLLPAVSLSEDPNSSFIGGTELKEVGKHDSDIQLPMTQTVCVQLPAMNLSEDTKSSFIKGTELKEVGKHDSDIPLPVAQASDVPLPTMSLPEDTKSSFIGGTELKEVDKHDSDMQPPITLASHVPLPAVSLSEDPKSSFSGGTVLKEVGKHDSDMQLHMTQTVRVQLHAPSLSKDSESSFVGGTELKEVDKHDSDMQPPIAQASHVPLPAVSLSKDPTSSFIGGTVLKEVGKHDSDIQLPMTQTVRVQLPAMSLSEDPKSSFIRGTELKEVDKHDSDIPLPMAHASHVPLPTVSLPEDMKSSSIGGTELKEVDKHDSDMQPPITPAIHVPLPAVSLSEDPKSSFTGGTELKEVGKHDSDMQLPMTQTVRVQLPALSLSKDPDSAFVGRTELKKVGQLDYSHVGFPQESILLSASKPSHPSGLPVMKFDDEVGSRSKKRKRSTADVLASHAQAMFEGGRLQCRRTPELAWADSTLTEKVDGEKAMTENSTFVSRARRRLTLTTSLIQCLLPALSVRLLAAKVADCGEAIVYHICKLMLSDISDPVQPFASDTNNFMQSENMPPNETSTSGKEEDCKLLSEVLETFDARLGGLQGSLSRVEKLPSFQDYASALHQIEQWAMTHQFIKLNEYKRLHAGYGSGPKRPLCVGAIRKHAGGSSAPVSELKRVRCRSLK